MKHQKYINLFKIKNSFCYKSKILVTSKKKSVQTRKYQYTLIYCTDNLYKHFTIWKLKFSSWFYNIFLSIFISKMRNIIQMYIYYWIPMLSSNEFLLVWVLVGNLWSWSSFSIIYPLFSESIDVSLKLNVN